MADEAQSRTGSDGGGTVQNAAALIAGLRSENMGSAPPAEAPSVEAPAQSENFDREEGEPSSEYTMPAAEEFAEDDVEAAPEAEQDIPEVDNAEDYSPEEEPVTLPATWTEAERQELSELPSDVQNAIVRREQEREAAFTQRQTELSSDREQLDDAVKMAGERWDEQLNNVDHLLNVSAQMHGFTGQEPNWAELRQTMDRDTFDDYHFNWQQAKKNFEGILAGAQQAKHQVNELVSEKQNDWIEAERTKTGERWPEYKANRDKAMGPLLDYLAEKGVPEMQRVQLNDDTFISVVQDAAKWHALQKEKPGTNKRVRQAKKVGRPGAPASNDRRKRGEIDSAKRNAKDTRGLAAVFSAMRGS